MFGMYSIYESVGVRWSWQLVVINKWKALPCVSGDESQSPGSSLQVDSPLKHYIHNKYVTRTYKKTVPALSGVIWFSLVLLQFNTRLETSATLCNFDIPTVVRGPHNETTTQKSTKSIRPPVPTVRDPIQSNWITSFVEWVSANDETLHLTTWNFGRKNVATEWTRSAGLLFKHLAHMKYTLLSNHSLIKKIQACRSWFKYE